MSENRMAERERLIELIKQVQDYGEKTESGRCEVAVSHTSNEELAGHLIKNGVVVLPCKVGDNVYFKDGILIEKGIVIKITLFEDEYSETLYVIDTDEYETEFWENDFGKTVFLTKEEAEQTLKQRKEDEGE